MSDALLAITLFLAATGLILYLGGLLFLSAVAPLRTLGERRRLQRLAARLRRADVYLQEGATDRVLAELQAAFCPRLAADAATAEAIRRHHTGLLSRLIAAADQAHGSRLRPISLAKVDRLLSERAALQQRSLNSACAGARARQKIRHAWRANTKALRAALTALAGEIASQARGEMYH